MEQGVPSRTAWSAACYRAVHQVIDGAAVFRDPYAVPMVGQHLDDAVAFARTHPPRAGMRFFVAARSRLAADFLGEFLSVPDAVAGAGLDRAAETQGGLGAAGAGCGVADAWRGVRGQGTGRASGAEQVVVLGAGLDTTAWRVNSAGAVRVFSVDHPDTQVWAKQVAARAGLSEPPCLVRVPVDFERDDLLERLAAAGFDRRRPAFISWLGVVPYLSRDAIGATLARLGSLAPGTTVVLDYGEPAESRSERGRLALEERRAGAARIGEPWLSFFSPPDVAQLLSRSGLAHVQDLGLPEILAHVRRACAPGAGAAAAAGRADTPNRAGGGQAARRLPGDPGPHLTVKGSPPAVAGAHPTVPQGSGHVVRAWV